MDELTKQWLQAIAYDDFHEDRFGLPDKNKKIKTSEKQVRRLEEKDELSKHEKESDQDGNLQELSDWL